MKPMKRAVEIAEKLVEHDDSIFETKERRRVANEISDSVRPLRDAAKNYLCYRTPENLIALMDALQTWEDIE